MTTYLQGTRQIYAVLGKAYWHGQFQPAKHSGDFFLMNKLQSYNLK